jgi:hypothetical protein
MIPGNEGFTLTVYTRDVLGKITGSSQVPFAGISDEETVYDTKGGTLNAIGRGTVYSSDAVILPEEGQAILIDARPFNVTKLFKAKTLGSFHHWEIVYG